MHTKIEIPQEFLQEFCSRWKICEFSLSGSGVRDDFRPDSDVDVLVRFEPDAPWDLWHMVDMREELVEVFGGDVDILEEEALRNPIRKKEILRTKVKVFEKEQE